MRSLVVPSTKGEVLSFLGLAAYLRTWIPSFALLAQPLYEAARGPLTEPLDVAKPIKTLSQTPTGPPSGPSSLSPKS
jgi:hypothetical protein